MLWRRVDAGIPAARGGRLADVDEIRRRKGRRSLTGPNTELRMGFRIPRNEFYPDYR